MYKLKNNKAFTIIELIVVIAIIAVLVMIAVPRFKGYIEKARITRIRNDIKVVEATVDEYLIDGNTDNWATGELSGNDLYDKSGKTNDKPENLKVVPSQLIHSKLKGNFYYGQGGKIYYEDVKKAGEVIVNEYTVTFLDHDGKILKEEIIKEGENANPPSDPTREGFEFIGWDKEFDNIVEDLEIKAVYEMIIPDGYTLATDADFEWVSNSSGYEAVGQTGKGYYKYIGSGGKVAIPHEIHDNPMTSYYKMFYQSEDSLTGVASSNKNVTDMSNMFQGSQATTLDLSNFDTQSVTNMSGMFEDSQATSLNLSSFDTQSVTNMSSMFASSRATTLDLSNFDTSNVKNMNYMFHNSYANTLDLSNFDTSNVTDMSNMFRYSNAATLDLSNFKTSNVTNMSGMFHNSNATTLDLSNFDTSNVTDMSNMFRYSDATTLDLSSFDTSNVTDMSYMFRYSKATTGYARTQNDADRFNASSNKPSKLTFKVKQ